MKTEVKNYDGEATVLEHDGSDVSVSYIERMQANIERDKKLISDGVPALKRLMEIAEANRSGQGTYVSRFLLGLYNGPRFPFVLTSLRGLDTSILDDCLAVLEMDTKACRQEVHDYFDNGGERFEVMAARYEEQE